MKAFLVSVTWTILALLLLPPVPTSSEAVSALLELAKQEFEIAPSDVKFFEAVERGATADYSGKTDEKNDLAKARSWPDERALKADRISWLCTDPEAALLVTGRGISIEGARIDGSLNLAFVRIPFPLFFTDCALLEPIDLTWAEVYGLYLVGTHTSSISAGGLQAKGDVAMSDGFQAEGEVRLHNAVIGGDLVCSGGHFNNKSGRAIVADGMEVRGSVFLESGFRAKGEVNFIGATICGNFECWGGHFSNEDAQALVLSRLKAKGDVNLSANFRAEGEVLLVGAEIEGDLICRGGQFINSGQSAIEAEGVEVGGSVFMDQGFQADGRVSLAGAKIAGFLAWYNVASPSEVNLDLRCARIGTLAGDATSWPRQGQLFLDGLIYDRIFDSSPIDVSTRIRWLRLQPTVPFHPQPYEQLADVLSQSGLEIDAKKILIEKNKDYVRFGQIDFEDWLWYRLFGPMVGYGYQPLNALWWAFGTVALGYILFGIGKRLGLITPSEDIVWPHDTMVDNQRPLDNYPRFNALVYSLDAFVPLVNLHLESYWLPNANRGRTLVKAGKLRLSAGSVLRAYLWIHILVGWIFTTLLIVGLTGLIRT